MAPLEETLAELSPGGWLLEGADAPPGDDPVPEPGTLRVRLYVEDHQVEAAQAALQAALAGYPGATLGARPLDPSWRERWKKWFKGFEVSPRLAVRPVWELQTARPGQQVIVIEPGMAFGTGQHETTRLCLEYIDALAEAGRLPRALLDVGCGTGILALGALLLGTERAVGVDVDPDAVAMARTNAERVSVEGRIELSTTPVGALVGQWPLVFANILAHIIEGMAEDLVARTAEGGILVLSGLLEAQEAGLRARFEALGMRYLARAQRGEWVRLELERPSPLSA